MPRVLIAVPLPDSDIASIAQWAEPVVGDATPQTLAGVDGALLTNRVPIDGALLDCAPRLRAVSVVGVGYDRVDVEACVARRVTVTNTPRVLTDAVADLTIGLVIALARRLPEAFDAGRSGAWRYELGVDLAGRTLAIIGFGRIGRAVAGRAAAFKMRVIGFDTRGVPPELDAGSFEDALRQADIVSLHVDLNPTSRHLIGRPELDIMKPGALLVNTSRGAAVDQRALYEALLSGRLGGTALDVLEREPPDPEDPLLSLKNVIVTPHIGSATRETRRAMVELAIANLRACMLGEPCDCVVI